MKRELLFDLMDAFVLFGLGVWDVIRYGFVDFAIMWGTIGVVGAGLELITGSHNFALLVAILVAFWLTGYAEQSAEHKERAALDAR